MTSPGAVRSLQIRVPITDSDEQSTGQVAGRPYLMGCQNGAAWLLNTAHGFCSFIVTN